MHNVLAIQRAENYPGCTEKGLKGAELKGGYLAELSKPNKGTGELAELFSPPLTPV